MARGLAVAVALGAVVACDGRPHPAPSAGTESQPRTGAEIAVLDLTHGAPEEDAAGLFGVPSGRGSFDRLVRAAAAIGDDADVKGVLVRFGGASLGIARAEELGDVLGAVRASGKPVFCHADSYSNATLMTAARGCSKIWVSPAGGVESIGIAAQVVYLRKLLADELHLSIDILQVGKFKGAEEPLTRDGPSDEARASLEGVLADMRGTWLDEIRKGRGGDAAAIAAEDGPYAPKKAKERGLVDEVGYADDALTAVTKEAGAVRDEVKFGHGAEDRPDDLASIVRMLSGQRGASAPIAVVRASGSIAMTASGGLFGGSSGITEHDLSRIFARLEKNDDVKAVVLRIDSPGGSALASDLIWHRMMKLRAKKPLVISVGDMAASGGYYLSCAGSAIVAEPTSIVGSIGVVGGKVAVGKALESIGVHAETFPARRGDPAAANRAAYLSPLVAWDEGTKARVLESMTGVYELFLARIAEGRGTTVDAIAPHAEGRIFSGRQAKEIGLVDELGGLGDAIAKARALAKLPADARITVVTRRAGLLDALEGNGDDDVAGASAEPLSDGIASRVASTEGAGILARIAPELVPFASSLAAIAGGASTDERALTALPYALVVR